MKRSYNKLNNKCRKYKFKPKETNNYQNKKLLNSKLDLNKRNKIYKFKRKKKYKSLKIKQLNMIKINNSMFKQYLIRIH